jgi:hypothetical protein
LSCIEIRDWFAALRRNGSRIDCGHVLVTYTRETPVAVPSSHRDVRVRSGPNIHPFVAPHHARDTVALPTKTTASSQEAPFYKDEYKTASLLGCTHSTCMPFKFCSVPGPESNLTNYPDDNCGNEHTSC